MNKELESIGARSITAYEKYMQMKADNEKLKERVKFLENLIKEYTQKMLNNLK